MRTDLFVRIAAAISGRPAMPDSGMIECAGCAHRGTLEQRTRREAPAAGPAPLVCSQCGHDAYFKLDIQGRRIP